MSTIAVVPQDQHRINGFHGIHLCLNIRSAACPVRLPFMPLCRQKKTLRMTCCRNGAYSSRICLQNFPRWLGVPCSGPELCRAPQQTKAQNQAPSQVGLKGQEPVLDGELPFPIKADDSVWNLSDSKDGRSLEISLAKADAMRWWPAVVKGQPEINLQKVREAPLIL